MAVREIDGTEQLAAERPEQVVAAAPAVPQAGDHFLPIRKVDIIEALVARGLLPGATDEENFRALCHLVSHIFHYEYFQTLETLRDCYFYFSPDVPPEKRPTTIDQDDAYALLVEKFDDVMRAANFHEVPPEEALEHDTNTTLAGVTLKIELDAFRDVKLFRRGQHRAEMEQRRLFGYWNRKFTADVYENVVLFVAVKPNTDPTVATAVGPDVLPPGSVIIKFFRNIVKADLRTLYPNARVVMGWKDTAMLGVPALFGLVPLSVKLLPALGVVLLLMGGYLGVSGTIEGDQLKQALAAVSAFAALGGFMMRQYGNYQRKSLKYQKQVADTVYFSNVNNNSGIFDSLIGAAEDQEVKEAILAYHFLAQAETPMAQPDLDRTIEAWLRETFGVRVDFEIQDAIAKLERIGIATRNAQGHVSVLPIGDALAKLDEQWDNFFRFAR